MNRFWKKRLAAMLLAVVMVAGMMPAAMAADCPDGKHQWGAWYESTTDSGKHERQCLVSGCTAKETAAHTWSSGYSTDEDAHWKSCTVCGVQQPHEAHSFLSAWQTDSSSHWEQCRTCGYRANEGGHIDKNLDGKCDTCGYNVGTPYVAVTFMNGSTTYKTQTNVVKGSAPANPGTPTYPGSGSYTFVGWVTSNPGSAAAYTGQSYYTSSQVASTAVSAATTYYAVYDVSSAQSIRYSLAPGGEEEIDARDFNEAYRDGKNTSNSIRWVEFTAPRAYTDFEGKLYYDYGGSGERELSRSDLNDNAFYYGSSSYGELDLEQLTFVADKSADEGSVTISFVACRSSSSYVEGELTLEISGESASATITYEVETDGTVDFRRADFNKAFQKEYPSYTVRWVEFATDDTLSSSTGALYYDYDGSDEKAFTKSSIDDYQFYYSDASYGDYGLADLTFAAGGSKRTVTLDFRAYYSTSRYVDGTVKIVVGGSSSSAKGDITYQLDPGGEVAFDRTDFNEFFQEEADSSNTIRYVEFSTSDTLSASAGAVYYDYDGSDEKGFTKSTLDDYRFYYSDSGYGDYALADLSFVAPKGAEERTIEIAFTAYYSSSKKASGTLVIEIGGGSGSKGDITYQLDPGEEVEFDRTDFNEFFQDEDGSSYTIKYVTFSTSDTLSTSAGTVYYDYDGSDEKAFTKSTIDDYKFYYSSASQGDYALADLSFVAPKGAQERTVEIAFTAYYTSTRKASGTLVIEIGEGSGTKADITYEVEAGEEVDFSRTDFNTFFKEETNSTSNLKYVTFKTDDTLSKTASGLVYYDYGGDDEVSFDEDDISDYKFYYNAADGDYDLSSLSFVAGKSFKKAITLEFTAYYSSSKKADGVLVIQPKETAAVVNLFLGDIVYYATYSSTVQIKASDISRFFSEKCPGSTLQSVVLSGVGTTGSLYYNYFGASKYGASKLKLTSANCKQYTLYASPTTASQYALTELLYVPSGSNYCTNLAFTAYGSGGKSVTGTILISVSLSAVGEVYGVTPKNTAVTFPASAISSAVASATGSTLSSIQLLKLPDSTVGTVYVGSGTTKANILTQYSASSEISQLRFVPTTGFTGSVEIPYVAYNSSGAAIAAGKFCLGVVNARKIFTDVTSSTWCYKYVVELADGKVIDGYSDGSFKPDNTITYGAALKLVMLAAGYPEQKPTDSNVFSGYLAKARAEGIITRSNVDLTKPITRLQVAQLAAGALKLDTSNLSSVQPFTDTTDPSVQALNAAGIVEGYFSSGTSTYKPNNTLTRGQVSAIVWRMRNYTK